jgi:predicted Zn finger-like uncharacterized protein
MIVSCPSCSARFRVADELIGADGRLVRCGRCAYSWHQMPMPDTPLPLELSEPLPEQMPPPLPPRDAAPLRPERRRGEEKAYFEKQRRRGSGFGGWLLFLLVLAAIAGAGWYWRNDIVAAVPESARVYKWLGIEVTEPAAAVVGPRLELVNYTFMRRLVDSERRLVVAGEIVNRTAEPQKLPGLRARVLDESGNEIMTWDFSAGAPDLQPGASVRFESQHEHPDYGGQINVVVDFLPLQ